MLPGMTSQRAKGIAGRLVGMAAVVVALGFATLLTLVILLFAAAFSR